MSRARKPRVDLVQLFNSVTTTLKENQQSLNAADEYNHNHGDNMVQNFQVITKAVRERKSSLPAEQLAYASELLSQRSQSGSAQLYSQGLAQASERLRGKPAVSQEDAMTLVQSLMGGQGGGAELLGGLLGGQSGQSGAADLLGSLLGGQSSNQGQTAGGDMLGGLLGSLLGGQTANQPAGSQAAGGIDMNTLLTAGMAFFQARQQGAEPMAALVQAVMAGSQMMSTTHHSQSGQLVAQTLLNTLSSMLAGKK